MAGGEGDRASVGRAPREPALRPEASLGYQIGHLGRLLGGEFRRRLAPLAVSPGQLAPLLELFRQDGLTQAELCARVDIEQPTMANTLTRMERDGLVTRAPHPGDGRRVQILLTDRARGLENDLAEAARAGNAAALDGLDDDQVREFMAVLALMIGNLSPRDPPPDLHP